MKKRASLTSDTPASVAPVSISDIAALLEDKVNNALLRYSKEAAERDAALREEAAKRDAAWRKEAAERDAALRDDMAKRDAAARERDTALREEVAKRDAALREEVAKRDAALRDDMARRDKEAMQRESHQFKSFVGVVATAVIIIIAAMNLFMVQPAATPATTAHTPTIQPPATAANNTGLD